MRAATGQAVASWWQAFHESNTLSGLVAISGTELKTAFFLGILGV
jgi:hypothetical protein